MCVCVQCLVAMKSLKTTENSPFRLHDSPAKLTAGSAENGKPPGNLEIPILEAKSCSGVPTVKFRCMCVWPNFSGKCAPKSACKK